MKEFSDKEVEALAKNVEKVGNAMSGAATSILLSQLKRYWYLALIPLSIAVGFVWLVVWAVMKLAGS